MLKANSKITTEMAAIEARKKIAEWYDDSTGGDPTDLDIINEIDEILAKHDGPRD